MTHIQKDAEKRYSFPFQGQKLSYCIIGTGKPLLLIHGYGVSGNVWQRCIPYLATQRQLFIVDLPGHGRSPSPRAWQLREIAPLLAEWIRSLNMPPCALVGHSMGGAISIHLVAHAPELFERLILVNAAGIPLQAALPELAVRSLRSMFQPGGGGYPLALLQDVMKSRPRVLWQAAHEMIRSDFQEELTTLTLPTLILWGKRDVLLPLQLGQALSEALPHAHFVLLPESGHRPPLAQPQLFSRLLLEFLQETQASRETI